MPKKYAKHTDNRIFCVFYFIQNKTVKLNNNSTFLYY